MLKFFLSMLFGGFLAAAAWADEVVDVDVSDAYGCALYQRGEVYCWGDLPGREATLPFRAERVAPLPPARRIAVGRLGACAIDREGVLWCWGLDLQRSLRRQEAVFATQPVRVEGLAPVRDADIGFTHICAITEARGAVWCWGDNACGELGCGDVDARSEPTRVQVIVDALRISAGVNNTCAVIRGGRLLCWGSDNPTMPGIPPFVYDSPDPLIFDEEAIGDLTEVSNGRNFACGIRFDGKVTCWGSNIMGQLGTWTPRLEDMMGGIGEVDGIDAAEDLSATYFGACAVQAGDVVCWGNADPGLDDPDATNAVLGFGSATKVGVGDLFSCAVADGRVFCWGLDDFDGDPLLPGMSMAAAVPVPGLPGEEGPGGMQRQQVIFPDRIDDLIAAGKPLEALRLIAALQAERGDDAYLADLEIAAHFDAARAASQGGDPEAAYDHYTQVIDLSPEPDTAALNNRAMILAGRGEFDAALADIDLALAADPQAGLYHANKCLLLREMDDLQGALGECDAAVAGMLPPDPENRAWIFLQRGLTLRASGDAEGAVGDFLKSMQNAKTSTIERIQAMMSAAGLYSGPIDGQTSDALDAAIAGCVLNDACFEQASAQMSDLIEFLE